MLYIPLGKKIAYGVNGALQTGCRFEVRGVTGYVGAFTNGNSEEIIGNSDYNVSTYRVNDGGLFEFDITLTSGNFGVQNNTPLIVKATPLKVSFT
jgi:hypothetical protein